MNRRAYLLGAAMVLAGNFVAVALRSFAEGAFVAAYGKQQLPWLFIASASGFAAATFLYDALTRRAQTRVVDTVLIALVGVAAAGAPGLLGAGVSPAVLVIALAALSQVVGLALWNRVAASVGGRDARRMLPRAGAAVTAGGVIAGLGAGSLAVPLGTSILPYLGAAASVLVLVLAIAQQRALAAGGAPGATAPPGTSESLGEPQVRLLHAMIAVALLEGIVATVIDLQFAAELKSRYKGETEFAVAFSLFYGGTNAILLLLQVTAVPRLLVTRSLPTTAAIHPALVIVWYVAFAMVPGFLSLAGTRTSDQVLRLATSRTAQEISLSAFPPGPRARWKVLLRGAVWPAGAASTALAILWLGPSAVEHPTRLAALTICVCLAWWVCAHAAARRFQAALAAPLGIAARASRPDPTRIDLATLERWTHEAGSDDARTAALARAALARARVDTESLGEHLTHDEPAVRAALFEQLARSPTPALKNELRAAVAIEEDDRAFSLGMKALALAGDDGGLARGRSRGAISRDIGEAVRSAEITLLGGDVLGEIGRLCARDPGWAAALVRAQRARLAPPSIAALAGAGVSGVRPRASATSEAQRETTFSEELLATTLREAAADRARRAGALVVIARVGPASLLPLLDEALVAGQPEALAAIADLDEAGAALLASHAAQLTPLARLAIARALARATTGGKLIAALLGDPDPEVAHAALRTALGTASSGLDTTHLEAGPIGAALESALAALAGHLDARDAALGAPLRPCAAHELELATRACVARLMWAAAVEAAAAGRDPAPLVATARRLVGGREPDRKRALDVVQELQAGRTAMLAVIERWLRPAVARTGAAQRRPPSNDPVGVDRTTRPRVPDGAGDATPAQLIAPHDRWLARLCEGDFAEHEATISALRRPALFATMAGPAVAALAAGVRAREVTGELFAAASEGDTMFVVTAGALLARRPSAAVPVRTDDGRRFTAPAPERRIEVGGVVGELAVLTRARRATTVVADGTATILEIDRETFAAAARRTPELVLGLSTTLAGWLAPDRPDVL